MHFIFKGAVKFVSVWSILGELEAFRNCKGLSVILSKSLHEMEHFTKVRIVLISHSIIFLNPEIKGFLFPRKLAKHGGVKSEKITSENCKEFFR